MYMLVCLFVGVSVGARLFFVCGGVVAVAAMLGSKPRALCMIGKASELHPSLTHQLDSGFKLEADDRTRYGRPHLHWCLAATVLTERLV